VWSSVLETLNLTGPSSTAIQRRGAVQKHTQSTHWLSIQIEDGSRLTARCRGVCDSSSVRTCHWGGCSKSLWRSEVMWAAGTWPQLPIKAPDCSLGPTQSEGAGAPRRLLCDWSGP